MLRTGRTHLGRCLSFRDRRNAGRFGARPLSLRRCAEVGCRLRRRVNFTTYRSMSFSLGNEISTVTAFMACAPRATRSTAIPNRGSPGTAVTDAQHLRNSGRTQLYTEPILHQLLNESLKGIGSYPLSSSAPIVRCVHLDALDLEVTMLLCREFDAPLHVPSSHAVWNGPAMPRPNKNFVPPDAH